MDGEIERIKRYIAQTNISPRTQRFYGMYADEFSAFYDSLKKDAGRTLLLVFDYGRAKGYRAAKASQK